MNDNQPVTEKDEVKIPETKDVLPVSPAPKTTSILIGIIFILAVALTGFVAFFYGSQNRTQTPPATIPTASPVSLPVEQTPAPSSDSNLVQYSSPQLTNFGFAYDPAIWSISQFPTPSDTKLTMSAKDGGILNFEYHTWYGVGGGAATFKSSELSKLGKSQLYRLKSYPKDKTIYIYGSEKSVNLFESDAESKTQALGQCQDMVDGKDGMFYYSFEQCSQIKSGVIAGFVNQPWFSWSFTFEPKVAIEEINAKWNEYDAYKNSENKNIVVEITYSGTHPESADAIVSQLKPL